jgi:thiopeptide-type bacteriocin biosynthesis protein
VDDQLCLFTLLYAPREQHEHIIGERVTPIAQAIRDAPELDSLFFARYNVPSWQLRFRILGRPGWISGPVLERVREGVKPLQEAGAIEAVELAEYDRELERYGGEKGMALAEKLFLHDSLAILELIAADRQGLLEKSWREIFAADDRTTAGPARFRPRAAHRFLRVRPPLDARDGRLDRRLL